MRVRSLLLVACCLPFWVSSLSASTPDGDDFNPESPADPVSIKFCRVSVSADPAEGAYVYGSGKYNLNGEQIYISSNAVNTSDYTYTFLYWTQNGVKTSYSQDFWFTPTDGIFEFVAHYEKKEVVFDPDNPQDPSSSNVHRRYFLYLTSNIVGACSFNMDSGTKIKEGTELNIYVNVNDGYRFDGWKLNGEIFSTDPYLYYTMPGSETTLEAVFTEIPYDPESPKDPTGPSSNVDNATRQIMDIAIGNGESIVDKTRIVFNEAKSLDYESDCDASKFMSTSADYQIYSLDSKGTKYSINERPSDNCIIPLGIFVKQAGQVTIKAKRLDCSALLVDEDTNTEVDLALSNYTFDSGAGTIEGRFSIKVPESSKIGDANGDGTVDNYDIGAIARYIMEGEYEGFVFKNADMNGDQKINAADIVILVKKLNK